VDLDFRLFAGRNYGVLDCVWTVMISLLPLRSFTSFPGSDTLSPGLVQDGTKCTEGRVCCVSLCIVDSGVGRRWEIGGR